MTMTNLSIIVLSVPIVQLLFKYTGDIKEYLFLTQHIFCNDPNFCRNNYPVISIDFFTLILFVQLYCYLALIELIDLLIMVTEFFDFF